MPAASHQPCHNRFEPGNNPALNRHSNNRIRREASRTRDKGLLHITAKDGSTSKALFESIMAFLSKFLATKEEHK